MEEEAGKGREEKRTIASGSCSWGAAFIEEDRRLRSEETRGKGRRDLDTANYLSSLFFYFIFFFVFIFIFLLFFLLLVLFFFIYFYFINISFCFHHFISYLFLARGLINEREVGGVG